MTESRDDAAPAPRAAIGRREVFTLLGAGAFAVAAVPALRRAPLRLHRRALPLMGTLAEVAVAHRDPRAAGAALDAAFAALGAVERAMTRFTAASDIGRVNASAAREAVPVGAATASVLREALAWAEASDGAFDPSVGRIVELWDVAHRTAPPPAEAVRRLADRRLYRAVDVAGWRGAPAVRLGDPEAALDLGGIAKGYGVDRAADALRAAGVRQGLVNVGGDLYALGTAPGGGPWRVGVRSPFEPARMLLSLEVEDAAIATSGDYLQYFTYAGARYHHLLDPLTAAPRRSAEHSVTVRAATCMAADAAATCAFGMSASRVARLPAVRSGAVAVLLRV